MYELHDWSLNRTSSVIGRQNRTSFVIGCFQCRKISTRRCSATPCKDFVLSPSLGGVSTRNSPGIRCNVYRGTYSTILWRKTRNVCVALVCPAKRKSLVPQSTDFRCEPTKHDFRCERTRRKQYAPPRRGIMRSKFTPRVFSLLFRDDLMKRVPANNETCL